MPYRPRPVAVIDSDRKGPGDSESTDARRLREVCNQHGLPCWVLAKREAENYLPRVLLGARPNAGAEHERWSTHGRDSATIRRTEEDLFDGLSDADREILAAGFGPNVHECWDLWGVREVRNELLTRGKDNLEHGIALIRREL